MTVLTTYFGTEPALRREMDSPFDLISVAREGVNKQAILHLAAYLDLPIGTLLSILSLSTRTWQRYDSTKVLAKEYTEKALQVAMLYQRGEEVFGDLEKFKGWINYPNPVFNGQRPVDLLDTVFGFQLLQDELIRIEHGVLA